MAEKGTSFGMPRNSYSEEMPHSLPGIPPDFVEFCTSGNSGISIHPVLSNTSGEAVVQFHEEDGQSFSAGSDYVARTFADKINYTPATTRCIDTVKLQDPTPIEDPKTSGLFGNTSSSVMPSPYYFSAVVCQSPRFGDGSVR
ncbi:hypothetical protein J3F83DRAFT_712387 [Trichoderma novae-zelandiae]